MKLANVKKTSEVLLQKGLNAQTLSSYFTQIVEHPLNHGKRLGMIRLSRDALLQTSVIIQIEEQLNNWQFNYKILAIWFEVSEQSKLLDDYIGSENETIQNRLLKKIKNYSKPSVLWCGQGAILSNSLFSKVSYCLVERDAGYPLIGYKPMYERAKSSFMLNHKLDYSNAICKGSHTCVLPVLDGRRGLLERLSSQPWQKRVCLNPSAKMKEIFLQANIS
ncbi:hypothetical protein OA92_06560 [Marinomonas sp. SBI22]|uniref:hypothetical protein n=1 Tax=unclassified Marinomonas TaxID=196814 RepID=UPI0007AF119D|nr:MULTISPECIES: hypothetical protein [unclassified Marinomonas]KZM44328.1 hypothetical protein OA92_06560 [Marinomonas sp. SBI22]KZM45486.1 hypothetical protein OA91_07705 [Marinomonas sp. SBI8L]